MINLAQRKGVEDPMSPNVLSTAEAATLQLEFRYLAFLTDNEEYWEKVEGVSLVCGYVRVVVLTGTP
jgi:hypothetical protein